MGTQMLEALFRLARWLVLPVVLLLFLQWPLRETLGPVSRQANDLGQILFALLVAVALTAATRAQAHIAVDALSRHYSARTRRTLSRIMSATMLVPWAAFLTWTAAPMAWQSLKQLERFADTANAGYFVIRAAVLLLGLLALVAGLADVLTGTPRREET